MSPTTHRRGDRTTCRCRSLAYARDVVCRGYDCTDVRTVSGRLGYADASTTLDIYAHFVHHADERAASNIGTVLDG
ncbi:MAG: hypothetical protein GWP48_15205 [Actinobacteria bacterium]|nr:hypothetical protein [Actinomycetota bacterium]